MTGEDDIYMAEDRKQVQRLKIERSRPLVTGDRVRDWGLGNLEQALWLYDANYQLVELNSVPIAARWLWVAKTYLSRRKRFGTPMLQRGLTWYEWQELYVDKLRIEPSIGFAFVATDNHFIFDRGGKVFNRSAPVIKLSPGTTEGEHIGLTGVLNSSVAAFWLKAVCHCKGAQGINEGAKSEKWEQFFEFSGTAIQPFPIIDARPFELARALDSGATRLASLRTDKLIIDHLPTRPALDEARERAVAIRCRMVFLQEELDWWCYRAYGLIADDLTTPAGTRDPEGIRLGERAFEIAMAREMSAGRLTTSWFERHGSTPITEIPAHWPAAYRSVVERRLEAIATNPNIRLIEQPEYKRRWNDEPWADQEARALREWLLTRMEDRRYWFAPDGRPQITSCARLADRLRDDRDFVQVAALYRGRDDFDFTALVVELAQTDAVPFLAAHRYSPAGRRKRAVWERTWELQRQEDAIDARTHLPESDPQHLTDTQAADEKARVVGDIDPPPKYGSGDFARPTYWRLRGKLDVPKERFILYPGAERDVDPTPVIGWAGWDHLEQARALAELAVAMRENEAWPPDRIAPLLAGLDELVPWLKQWHNDRDPATGECLGDYFAGFVTEEARSIGLTLEALRALEPARPRRGRRSRTQVATPPPREGTP